MSIRNLFRKIRDKRFSYNTLVEVMIFKDHLLHNLRIFEQTYPKVKIAPVLKSNAYGHGLIEVANVFDSSSSTSFFVIDSYHEALILRNEGIKKPLVLLGYVPVENILDSKLECVNFGITSIEQLKRVVEQLHYPQTFHLKVDTGMHRQGILPEEIQTVAELIKRNPNIILEGLCSHFADADGVDDVFSQKQMKEWKYCIAITKKLFSTIKYYHLANTAGTYLENGEDTNIARVGIGLYGVDTQKHRTLSLKPALELRTVVGGIKKIKKGESVGYGVMFTAPQDMTIATIPVGYYEGIDIRLSNKGNVLVRGKKCSIVGRVSMNITTIDVSSVADVTLGEPVVVISADSAQESSVAHIAKQMEALPYEVLVHIPATLRRVVV